MISTIFPVASRLSLVVFVALSCQQLSASEGLCKQIMLGAKNVIAKATLRSRFKVVPYQGFEFSREARKEVIELVSDLESKLNKGISLPKRLEVYIAEAGSRSYHESVLADDGTHRIVSVFNPSILLHEIGHTVFKSNLDNSNLPFAIDLYEYQTKLRALKRKSRRVNDVIYSAMREMGSRFDSDEHPYFPEFERYKKMVSDLSYEYRHVRGLELSIFWKNYDELFADTLVYAFTGNPSSITEAIESAYPNRPNNQISVDARDFDSPVSTENWGSIVQHMDPHNYFGPTNYEIGKHLKGLDLSMRMEALRKIYHVLLEDIQSQLSESPDGVFSINTLLDIREDNERLISRIRFAFTGL